MTHCSGAPAEHLALAYLEGDLSPEEMNQFEDHFFDCQVCHSQLQALQALQAQLATHTHAQPHKPVGWLQRLFSSPLLRPQLALPGFALACGIVALAFVLSRPSHHPAVATAPAVPAPAGTASASPAPAATPSAAALADLALPAFQFAHLRGDDNDSAFDTAMLAYQQHDCAAAIRALAHIPASSRNATAARFYSGACQLSVGHYDQATALLSPVADDSDSPQQEYARYELAQLALARNNPALAHTWLTRTIALQGDLESRARRQDHLLLTRFPNQGTTTLP